MWDVTKDINDFIEIDKARGEVLGTEPPSKRGLFYGIIKGSQAYGPSDTRTEGEQKAWDKYYDYKTPFAQALKDGLIDEVDFNFIKGKAGSATVVNHFIDKETHPDLNNYMTRAINIPYQLIQTVAGDQSLWDGVVDYWEQGIGSGDTRPLGTPQEELDIAIGNKKNRK